MCAVYSDDKSRSAADLCDSSTVEGPFAVDKVELSLIERAHTCLFFVIGGHQVSLTSTEREAFEEA